MDDATSTLYSALLVEEEGTASTFRGLLEVFDAKGLPLSLYTDRGSHYFVTLKAGETVDRGRLTQVGWALKRLGIEHIAAYSPQARGHDSPRRASSACTARHNPAFSRRATAKAGHGRVRCAGRTALTQARRLEKRVP